MDVNPTYYIQIFLKSGHELFAYVWRDDYDRLMSAFNSPLRRLIRTPIVLPSIDGGEIAFRVSDINFVIKSKDEPEDIDTEDEYYDE